VAMTDGLVFLNVSIGFEKSIDARRRFAEHERRSLDLIAKFRKDIPKSDIMIFSAVLPEKRYQKRGRRIHV
jgi:hypothetical protein